MKIDYNSLKYFVKTLEGQPLKTGVKKREFYVRLTEKGFEYIPKSTNKPRLQPIKFIEQFLDHFHKTESFQVKNYTDISRNASYLLVLIERYLNKPSNLAESIRLGETDSSDYLDNLESYENLLARGEIQW